MATEFIQVCRTWTTNADDSVSCSAFEWIQGYVLPPEAGGQIDLLIHGGFDPELFQVGFMGTLSMFSVGFGVGLIISQIRKLRR